jgi:hypothetical protein
MANYLIIGGDGKEYGPVTDADVRQWIAEGRLAATSEAKAESDAEFRTLAQFPEFAEALAQKTPTTIGALATGAASSRSAALQEINVPAKSLKIVAVLNFSLAVWDLIKLVFFPAPIDQMVADYPQLKDPSVMKLLHLFYGPLGIAEAFFGMLISALIFVGAGRMQLLKNYEFAFVAAVLSLVPCMTPCCVLGLPFGIWALVVMNRKSIKSEFH